MAGTSSAQSARALLSEVQIVSRNDYERQALLQLKDREFCHVRTFESIFIIRTGLRDEMNIAIKRAGWEDFWPIEEKGSKLLTMEFLSTLSVERTEKGTKIYFRFFNEQYIMTDKELSVCLGFHKKCIMDPDDLAKIAKYDRAVWWNNISGETVSSKLSVVSIHNPTLRFLAKWLNMVIHPSHDLRLCNVPELQYLFAMVKKIKLSPVMSMVNHWIKMIKQQGPIEFCSLITRIAIHVGALDGATLMYLPDTQDTWPVIGSEHFIHAHMLRESPDGALFMRYPGYQEEFELPCPALHLSAVKMLTLPMQKKEPARHSVAGPMTRSRSKRAREEEAGTSAQPQTTQPQPGLAPSPNPYSTGGYTYGSYAGGYQDTNQGTQSYGPQVGPSSSARFASHDPYLRHLSYLEARVETMDEHQTIMQEQLEQNNVWTQETHGMVTSLRYDFNRMNLG